MYAFCYLYTILMLLILMLVLLLCSIRSFETAKYEAFAILHGQQASITACVPHIVREMQFYIDTRNLFASDTAPTTIPNANNRQNIRCVQFYLTSIDYRNRQKDATTN